MPNSENIIIVSFAAIFFLFVIMLIFAFNMFHLKQQRKFSIKNEFPFELIQGNEPKYLSYFVVLMLLVTTATLLFGFNVIQMRVYFYEYMFLGAYIASAVLLYLMFFLRMNALKRHLLVAILYFLMITTSFISFGLIMQFSPFITNNLPLALISYLFGLLAFGLALNPKLIRWPIMDKIQQQDGTIIILRPKKFILAYYEWIYIGLNFVLFILMFISLLIV